LKPLRRRLLFGAKIALAAAIVWWLIDVNVTAVDVAIADLTGEPVSGEVVDVLVSTGETVTPGQPLLELLEPGGGARQLTASRGGRIESLGVAPGDRVSAETVAMTLASAIPFAELWRLRDSWPWLALAQAPFGIVLCLAAWRWRILLEVQGIRYSFREAHSLILIGTFFNQVMLGSTGGDVVKAYYVAVESKDRRTAAVATVFLDRALGLIVLVAIGGVAVFANLDLVLDDRHVGLLGLAAALWITLCAATVAGFLFFSEAVRSLPLVRAVLGRLPLQRFLRRLSDSVYVYKSRPREMVRVVLLSVAIHLLVIVTNLLFVRCLQSESPDGLPFLLLVPLAQIIMAVPLTPASLGTAEAAYDKLFALAGVPTGALVSILQRLTYYFWSVFGCVAYLHRKRQVREALAALEARSPSGNASGGRRGADASGERRVGEPGAGVVPEERDVEKTTSPAYSTGRPRAREKDPRGRPVFWLRFLRLLGSVLIEGACNAACLLLFLLPRRRSAWRRRIRELMHEN
jgi:hypothetical protein